MRLIDADITEKILRAYADEVGCRRGEIELANGILKAVCRLEDVPTVEIVPITNVSEKVKELTLDAEKIKREARKEYATELIEWVNGKYLIDDTAKAILLTHFELEQMKCEKQIKTFNDCEQSYLQSAT